MGSIKMSCGESDGVSAVCMREFSSLPPMEHVIKKKFVSSLMFVEGRCVLSIASQ